MSLRTSAHTGVAIRVPAGKGNDKCAFGRIRSIFSYSPKVLLSVMLYCKENGLPRRCAPRNDMLKENRFSGCKNVVRNGMQRLAGCRRLQEPFLAAPWHHLLASATTHLSSACHCEPVRTLAWQSASPQKCLANWLLVGRIRRTAAYSPKVLLSVMLYCKENGLPRRCAPRNDMQKHAVCPHRQGRCTRQNCHRLRTFPRVPPPCTR